MRSTVLQTLKILILVFIASLGITYVSAWSGPPGPPFDCPSGYVGCDGPLHIGGATQTKAGGLNLGGALDVTGSVWGGGLFTNGSAYIGGVLGIGTSLPTSKLHVSGGSVRVSGGNVVLDNNQYVYVAGAGTLNLGDTQDDVNLASSALFIKNAGNVGIGTITPTTKLDVNGTARVTGLQIPTNAGANKVLTSDASGNATWQALPTSGTGGGTSNTQVQGGWCGMSMAYFPGGNLPVHLCLGVNPFIECPTGYTRFDYTGGGNWTCIKN